MKEWAKLIYATIFLVLAVLTIQFFPDKEPLIFYVKWSAFLFCLFATGHFITR